MCVSVWVYVYVYVYVYMYTHLCVSTCAMIQPHPKLLKLHVRKAGARIWYAKSCVVKW